LSNLIKEKLSEVQNINSVFFSQTSRFNIQEHYVYNNPTLKLLEKYSWNDTRNFTIKLAHFLKEQNLSKGDRVLLVSENRPEWTFSDIAIMLNGAITVPTYITYTKDDYEFIIRDSTPVGLIVSNQKLLDKILDALKETDNKFRFIVSLDNITKASNLVWFDAIRKKNIDLEDKISFFKNLSTSIIRKDPSCIIYTSGTTGKPKGVTLSHGGILKNIEGALELLSFVKDSHNTFLTWLPLNHSFEHMVQFVQLSLGAKVFYNESVDKLLDNLKLAKPTIMTAVPRFYTTLVNKIKIGLQSQSNFKKALFNRTIELGTRSFLKKPMSFKEKVINKILDILVRKKAKSRFGGQLKAFISGAAPLDFEVGVFLNALGLPTLQGYGLTESSPAVSCNPIDKIKIETVGKILKDVDVKIADDGEILIKGENVMLGYWNNKKDTDLVLKGNWLFTGDIGEIDTDGYLKITDRKKDIIVNSGGDNIAPSKIENMLSNYPEVIQSFIYGDKKSYLVALIVVDSNLEEKHLKVKNIIEKLNEKLSVVERIRNFLVISDAFTIENGLLTPTMKVKRNKVKEIYGKQLESLYK